MVCPEGTIKLVDGEDSNEGRVEICVNNAWSTICDNEWGLEEAIVVCNQLGLSSNGNDYIHLYERTCITKQ